MSHTHNQLADFVCKKNGRRIEKLYCLVTKGVIYIAMLSVRAVTYRPPRHLGGAVIQAQHSIPTRRTASPS